jgi:hypothetical protein
MTDARHRPLSRVPDLPGQASQSASVSPMPVPEAKSTVALRPWEFPNAARRHTVTAARLRPRTRRTYRFLPTSSGASSTTRAIVADYLALCRNPLRNIVRWIAVTGAKIGFRAQASSSPKQVPAPPLRLPQTGSPLSLRPWVFPQAGRRHTIASTRLRRTGRKFRSLRTRPYVRLTTRNLAADYLSLCRNPLKDIHRWIVETKTKTRSAHAHHFSGPFAGNPRFRSHPLHALRGRMDAQPGERHQDHHLSSRPGAGADQYDQLRPVRAEGAGVGPPLLHVPAEAQGEAALDSGDSASELANIRGYFDGLIAAARSSLSGAEATAVIGRLRIQKILAMRAVKDRRRAARSNQRRTLHSGATAAGAKRQLG